MEKHRSLGTNTSAIIIIATIVIVWTLIVVIVILNIIITIADVITIIQPMRTVHHHLPFITIIVVIRSFSVIGDDTDDELIVANNGLRLCQLSPISRR